MLNVLNVISNPQYILQNFEGKHLPSPHKYTEEMSLLLPKGGMNTTTAAKAPQPTSLYTHGACLPMELQSIRYILSRRYKC